MEDTLPWPPPPEDIIDSNINLPDPVYNLIAWISTEDNGNDPITSARISVPMKVHMKVQLLLKICFIVCQMDELLPQNILHFHSMSRV